MLRKQIYLDEESRRAVEKLAVLRGVSESFIIREAIAQYVTKEEERAGAEDNPLVKLIGIGEGTKPDAAENHDRYLYKEDKD